MNDDRETEDKLVGYTSRLGNALGSGGPFFPRYSRVWSTLGECLIQICIFLSYAFVYADFRLALLLYSSENQHFNRGGQWTYSQIVRDKSLRLLIPGLCFSVLAFVVKALFPGDVSRQVGFSFEEILHAFLWPNDNPLRELWFIVTLFWMFLLTPLWKATLKNGWMMLLSVAVLGIIHFLHSEVDILCIGRVFQYALWFYLGLLMAKMNVVEKLPDALIVLLIGTVIYALGVLWSSFVATVGGIVLSVGLALLFDKFLPPIFCSFRDYTYQIFLMGIFVQMAIKILYNHIDLPYAATYVACILAGLYVPVLLAKIVEYINWKPLSLCYGLKLKK